MTPATTSPDLPSLLISGAAAAGGVVHAEYTSATKGELRNWSTISVPTARAAELGGQQFGGTRRLGRRILEPGGREALDARNTEGGGTDHDQHRDDDDPTRHGDGQMSDVLQYARPFGVLSPLRISGG